MEKSFALLPRTLSWVPLLPEVAEVYGDGCFPCVRVRLPQKQGGRRPCLTLSAEYGEEFREVGKVVGFDVAVISRVGQRNEIAGKLKAGFEFFDVSEYLIGVDRCDFQDFGVEVVFFADVLDEVVFVFVA